jgi:ParB family chromosome partitioning protein
MSPKKRGLGRGLDALLTSAKPKVQDVEEQSNAQNDGVKDSTTVASSSELQKLPIEFLHPGKYQPRKDMSEEALEELASSIRA